MFDLLLVTDLGSELKFSTCCYHYWHSRIPWAFFRVPLSSSSSCFLMVFSIHHLVHDCHLLSEINLSTRSQTFFQIFSICSPQLGFHYAGLSAAVHSWKSHGRAAAVCCNWLCIRGSTLYRCCLNTLLREVLVSFCPFVSTSSPRSLTRQSDDST